MKMKFGIFMAPFHAPYHNPTLSLEQDLSLLEHLDRLGFDEAWIGEHHSAGSEIIAAPEIFIMAAAARTRHIKLGTGVVSLPYCAGNRSAGIGRVTACACVRSLHPLLRTF